MTTAYSNSQLQSWKNCPLQWRFHWDLGLRPIEGENDHHLRFGDAIHKGLEQYYRVASWAEIRNAFESAYPTQIDINDHAKTRANGIIALADYVKRYRAEDKRQWKVLAIETRSDDPWSVKPDLIVENIEHGGVYVVDHKAQPLASRLLTPEGWLPMWRVKIGTDVIGSDGFPCKVIGIFPQGKLPCYKITFSDNSSVKCSDDHLWTGFFSHNTNPHESVTWTLRKIRESLSRNKAYRFRVPFVEPVRFQSRPLPLHPYLLGALLGDGFIAGHTPQISVGDFDTVATLRHVKECLPAGIGLVKCIGNFSWSMSGTGSHAKGSNPIKRALIGLNLWGTKSATKFIPEEYLYADVEQRKALLQGLLDTDGCCYDGHIYFDSISSRMTDDVVALVRSLGGYAKRRNRKTEKQPGYRVDIRFDNDVIPFRLERKLAKRRAIQRLHGRCITSIELLGEEEMQCIQVAAIDGLYVTDDFVLTHNTTGQYLNYRYWERYQPNSQITHYLDYAQSKYGPIEGFVINAISFRFREKPYYGRGSKKGTFEPAGFWSAFERQTFNRNPQQLEYERLSRADWIRDIERSRENHFFRTNTDSCWKCQFKPICAAGWTWEEDKELIQLQYRQVCGVECEGGYCVLDRGHDEAHCAVAASESEFVVEVEA